MSYNNDIWYMGVLEQGIFDKPMIINVCKQQQTTSGNKNL